MCVNIFFKFIQHDNSVLEMMNNGAGAFISLDLKIKNNLTTWALQYNIPHNALNGLLLILKEIPGLEKLPKDSRSVLKTRQVNETNEITVIEPGLYFHFGLASAIKRYFLVNPTTHVDVVKIVIGIDGLPISKSSNSAFWPILGYIRPHNNLVFPIGIYWGNEKPYDSNKYLEEFVFEANYLLKNGINIDGTDIKVVIDGFSMDAPAKSFILRIKGHTGFDSCTRCIEEGEHLNNRTCFPYTPSCLVKRTHDDYINKKYEEHHIGDSISILSGLPDIDLVSSISLDYMHLTCLGIYYIYFIY